MTRVVHVSTVHNPLDTRILFRECGSLANAGYSVTLLASNHGPIKTNEIEEVNEVNGVRVLLLTPPRNRLQRMTSKAFEFVRKAVELDADIYHFHDPELALWMWVLHFKGKKVVFDVHEDVVGSLSDRSWIPKVLLPVVSGITKHFLPILMRPYFIVFAEKSYPASYPFVKNYEVILNYPNLTQFPRQTVEKFDAISIVYVGSISEARGIIEILDALVLLQARNVFIDFYLVGKSNLATDKDLAALVAERSLERVHILGFLPQPEALAIVSKCHIGLAILHPVKNYMLSYPTKIFEYMACGIPFITSNFPLYQEVVEKWKCGITVDPTSPEKLAESIELMIGNPTDLSAMGDKGRVAAVTEYNWEREEQKLIASYVGLQNVM